MSQPERISSAAYPSRPIQLWLRRLVFGVLYAIVLLAVALVWPLVATLLWLANDPVSFKSWIDPWVEALWGSWIDP